MTRSSTDANRREIAGAACDLVADSGLDSVSLRRIARHLGSTTGYISHYYLGKEDLLEAALRTALDELTSHLGGPSTTVQEWVDNATAILPSSDESPRFWRVLTAFWAASLNSVKLSAVLRDYTADHEATLACHLTAVVPTSAPSDEVRALARSLFAVVAGLGTTSTITPGVFTEHQLRTVVQSAAWGLIDEFTARHATDAES